MVARFYPIRVSTSLDFLPKRTTTEEGTYARENGHQVELWVRTRSASGSTEASKQLMGYNPRCSDIEFPILVR